MVAVVTAGEGMEGVAMAGGWWVEVNREVVAMAAVVAQVGAWVVGVREVEVMEAMGVAETVEEGAMEAVLVAAMALAGWGLVAVVAAAVVARAVVARAEG